MSSNTVEESIEHIEIKAKVEPKPSLNLSVNEHATAESILDINSGKLSESDELGTKEDQNQLGVEEDLPSEQVNNFKKPVQNVEIENLGSLDTTLSKVNGQDTAENGLESHQFASNELKENDTSLNVADTSVINSLEEQIEPSKELNRPTEEKESPSTEDQAESIPTNLAYEDIIDRELAQAEKKASQDDWLYILGHDRLRKRIIRAGESDTRPTHGQRVTVRCSGHVEGAPESETIDSHESLSFVLGDGDFIHAFDLTVALMDRGEICEVFTESRFAYGSLGRAPDVPPDANVLYTIELLGYEDVPDPSTLPIKSRVELGDAKRERGNELYGRQEYSRAVDQYTRALKLLDDELESHSSDSVEDLQLLVDTRLKCYNNLAAAQIMVEAWDAAIKSCDKVLLTQPENVKALFRKAKCLMNKGETTLALACLRKAQRIEPDNKIVQQELLKLSKRCKADAASERALYQRMLGTGNNVNSTTRSSNDSPTSSRMLWYLLGAGAAAVVATGLAAYRYTH